MADLIRASAVTFDFNGTLSHDEPILYQIFADLFAERGRPLSAEEYFDQLAGLSDPEIVWTWLGRDHPGAEQVIEERWVREGAFEPLAQQGVKLGAHDVTGKWRPALPSGQIPPISKHVVHATGYGYPRWKLGPG